MCGEKAMTVERLAKFDPDDCSVVTYDYLVCDHCRLAGTVNQVTEMIRKDLYSDRPIWHCNCYFPDLA